MKAYKQAKRNDAKTTAKLKQSVTDSYQSQTDTSPSASSLANHNASPSPLPNQNAASNHVTYPDDEIVQKEMYSASMNKYKYQKKKLNKEACERLNKEMDKDMNNKE